MIRYQSFAHAVHATIEEIQMGGDPGPFDPANSYTIEPEENGFKVEGEAWTFYLVRDIPGHMPAAWVAVSQHEFRTRPATQRG